MLCTTLFFLYTDLSPPHIYPLSLHDALPIYPLAEGLDVDRVREDLNSLRARSAGHHRAAGQRTRHENARGASPDRKSTRLNSSHRCISYAVFCLKKKKKKKKQRIQHLRHATT